MSAKVLIGGAGGAPSEGVINSLLRSPRGETLVGIGSEPTDLLLSNAHTKYWVPYANTAGYPPRLLEILGRERPDLVHFQNDAEIFRASQMREAIHAAGCKTFMPTHEEIDLCVHKYKSWLRFRNAGVPVPTNILLNDEDDLKRAFRELGSSDGRIWLRSASIGAGGKGALPTADYQLARSWIDHHRGWGDFIAAEILTPDTVTWLSIWYEGELVTAQTRVRQGWTHANRAISGVTGVTKVGKTFSDDNVTRIAIAAIESIARRPHGIYGVDMAYDQRGVPNPTEINISRFFTTVLFFTEAGLNMPEIFKNIALYGEFPVLPRKINPLPDGLMWIRGMDTRPRLIRESTIEAEITFK